MKDSMPSQEDFLQRYPGFGGLVIQRRNTLLISRMFSEVLRIRAGQVVAFMSPTSTHSRNCFFEVIHALGRENQEFLEKCNCIVCTDSDWSIDFSPIAERMGYSGYGATVEFRYPTALKGHPLIYGAKIRGGFIDEASGHSFFEAYP